MSKTSFGIRLREILAERGMSQSDLARLVFNDVHVGKDGKERVRGKEQISNYISGNSKPSFERYHVLLKALQLTPRDLPIKGTRRLRPQKYGNKDSVVLTDVNDSTVSVARRFNMFPLTRRQGSLDLSAPEVKVNVAAAKSSPDMGDLIAALDRLTNAINKLAN
jgi:transcriptional regulator with XRE-family HTH domain